MTRVSNVPSCAMRRAAGWSVRPSRWVAVAASVLILVGAVGCHPAPPLDVLPLINSGMSYDTVKQLKGLNVTQAEVLELADAHRAGLSEAGCVELLGDYRLRKEPFDGGDVVSGLLGSGLSEKSVLELARMNELGLDAGELQAMRLAGLSDAIILQVARRHAGQQPVLSGVSLARLKNTGLRESTLLQLTQRGIPDGDAGAILAYRRHGASDAAILKRFSGT